MLSNSTKRFTISLSHFRVRSFLVAFDPLSVTVFQAFVLGILQGLAEFLPISSSAHLALAPWILHWPDPGLAFDVALHFGTLLAVLWYFRAEWIALVIAAKDIVVKRRVETDPKLQERIAREEFGLVRGDKELLYRFAEPDTSTRPAQRSRP